jgi:TonB family protein
MLHGVHEYYRQLAQFERRLALTILAVACAFLGGLLLVSQPALLRHLPLTANRFGYEGRERFVTRILLESMGTLNLAAGPELTMIQQEARKGGSPTRPRSRARLGEPDTRQPRAGPGDSPEDLMSRARAIYRSAPVVQSEDLVIERLVKPQYPEDARNRNIEGKVALVALVDTTGAVAQVDVIGTTGERQLEKAATEAVWQCRFRPYKVNGETREVYAMFRFSFRIY